MQKEGKQLQVLLVEDSQWTVAQVSETLEETSSVSRVHVASTEKDAIALAKQHRPDIVVLDLQLAEGTGFSVIRKLKADGFEPPVIVLTNYALPKYRDLALLLGAKFFLDKSRDIEMLPSVIESIAQDTGDSTNGS